ncbi:radical SAM protein [Streptomyces sp. 8K308]|uniref:B12-binding domain-containing radical SAM protein n=1 Tax=Streptomyces sp. 8K308 TaxID=2530388 RepID=UPI00104CA3D8|nr:cobalamin-dependent protein [Streptomyces sp. 8K308]TDC22369.1 radical SAM protein [Streptomyces sp. 8K308]
MNPQTENDDMREIYGYHENLALALIAATLRKHGHHVVLVDQRVRRLTDREVARHIAREGAELVGFSVNYATLKPALKVAQLLKMTGAPTVVFGGEHVTYLDDGVLGAYACVDLVVRGEGEEGFLAVADALRAGDDVRGVRGISYWDREADTCVRTPTRSPAANLDDQPFASRDVADQALAHGIPIEIGILGQRGCPFPCSFCNANRFLGNETRGMRYRSAANIADEIEELGPRLAEHDLLLRFYDATWITRSQASRAWAVGLCDELERRGLRVPFDVFVRSDSFDFTNQDDLRLIRRLRRAGMVSTYLGLEAGDDEVLDVYNKKVHANASIRAFEEFRRAGVSGSTNGVITFHQSVALPQIANTVTFLERLGLCTLWNLCSRVETLPGIRLGDEMITRPRRAVWDVLNYAILDRGARSLYELLTATSETSYVGRLEDFLSRRLRDVARVRDFRAGEPVASEITRRLDRDIRDIQRLTSAFAAEAIDGLIASDGRRCPDRSRIVRYTDDMLFRLRQLATDYRPLLGAGPTDWYAAAA